MRTNPNPSPAQAAPRAGSAVARAGGAEPATGRGILYAAACIHDRQTRHFL